MEQLIQENILWFFLLMVWTLPWKGYALWSASKLGHKWWFIALLLINSIAILDIIYIFLVAKRGKALAPLASHKEEKGRTELN